MDIERIVEAVVLSKRETIRYEEQRLVGRKKPYRNLGAIERVVTVSFDGQHYELAADRERFDALSLGDIIEVRRHQRQTQITETFALWTDER